VGIAAIAALPPLNGLVGEWLIALGLLGAAGTRNPAAAMAIPAAIVMAAAGALALAAFLKAGAVIFLGAPRTKAARDAHESRRLMLGPMAALAGMCLAIGLAPAFFWLPVARAVGAWNPAWASVEPPAPLLTLGLVNVALAALFAAGAALLAGRARTNGLRRSPTWDCGYSVPTARMQYTAGSFAGIVTGWFSWILRTARTQHRPRGPFPAAASRIERVPETVLERILRPAGGGVMQLAGAARRLQHGRLQFYIVYVAAALAALGILAAMEALK
jgi:hydrogenase-4 component B